jgi:hypothetical protein
MLCLNFFFITFQGGIMKSLHRRSSASYAPLSLTAIAAALAAAFVVAAALVLAACEDPTKETIYTEKEVIKEVEKPIDIVVPSNGIIVHNAAELAKIGADPDWPLTADYVLLNDIDLSAEEFTPWTPIGSDSTTPFSGHFDGNNKTISGLTLGGGGVPFNGLFGYTSYAQINNLNIDIANDKDTRIILTGATTPTGTSQIQYMGVLAGWVNTSRISDITVTAKGTNCGLFVTADTTVTGVAVQVGGVGGVIGNSTTSGLQDIHSDIPLSSINATNVGGVVGTAVSSSLLRLEASGSLASSGTITRTVGGVVGTLTIVGSNPSSFVDCTGRLTEIKVDTTVGVALTVGGVIGNSNTIAVTGCVLAAATDIKVDAQVYPNTTITSVGGICGSTSAVTDGCSIIAPAKITVTTQSNGLVKVGGLSSSNNTSAMAITVTKSFISAPVQISVTRTRNAAFTTGTPELTYIGGLIPIGPVTDCYSYANIEAITSHGSVVAGGLAATSGAGTITNSYAKGKIVVENNTPAPFYVAYVGGIVGSSSGTIKNTVALNSDLRVSGSSTAADFINRIAGYGSGTLRNNYSTFTGTSAVDGVSGASVTRESLNEAYFKTTPLNWNFTDVWEWSSTTGLPVLK